MIPPNVLINNFTVNKKKKSNSLFSTKIIQHLAMTQVHTTISNYRYSMSYASKSI